MNVTIDNRQIQVKEGLTVLDAAAEQGIYIPHLCSHRELTPYGGCRLCIIEIEGRRGYPTACTATVEEGMVVRTESQTLQEMRRGLIQLILSEHPSGCLVCGDIDGCSQYQGTIRKVGVTTGCRWCPRDEDCELQKVVKHLEIGELTFPVLYRGMELEKFDPFFDRDYNLCIYCGRCVRICQEFRRSSVLALRERGKLSTIGTSFDDTHVKADCEFCGACVSVCPTGAMSERTRKWWGVPDHLQEGFCPLCSMACDLQILPKQCKIVGTLPPGDPHYSGGELCVKGRFCLSVLVNRSQRVMEPECRYPEGVAIETWDEILSRVPEKLAHLEKDKAVVLLSPNLTIEEMGSAKLFAEKVLNTSLVTSSALTANMVRYLTLSEKIALPSEIEMADGIVSFWMNGNYNYAPVTLAIKRAVEKGAGYIQTGWLKDTTSRFAAQRVLPIPGREAELLDEVCAFLEHGNCRSEDGKAIGELLKSRKDSAIVVGPSLLCLTSATAILAGLKRIMELSGAKVLILAPSDNLAGLLSLEGVKVLEEVEPLIRDGKIDVLYGVGDMPFESRPPVKCIACQSSFVPSEALQVDYLLPAALWGETGGTIRTLDGREKSCGAPVIPQGMALPHREIFARIANALGRQDSLFGDDGAARALTGKSRLKPPHASAPAPAPATEAPAEGVSVDSDFPAYLVVEKNPHRYSGICLSDAVEGFREIVPEDTILLNPVDAAKLAVSDGDRIVVSSRDRSSSYPVMTRKIIPTGYASLVTSKPAFARNPCPVAIRRENV